MFYIGLDLGQKVDSTAVAIIEQRDPHLRWMEADPMLYLRYLERMPLGTPYPAIVERVRRLTLDPALGGRCELTVDATGCGTPVIDLLGNAQLRCPLTPVTITSGGRARSQGSWWHVPKAELITNLQLLIEKGEIRIAKAMPETVALVRELTAMTATAGPSGYVRMGAEGAGEHDDLVLAVALACWQALRPRIGFGGRALPGL